MTQAAAEARAARILSRLDSLFEIGRAEGTNRPGLGDGEQRAFEQVAGWSGQAARAAVMRMFIEHALATPGVRCMRRGDIARWWLDTYPPETGSKR